MLCVRQDDWWKPAKAGHTCREADFCAATTRRYAYNRNLDYLDSLHSCFGGGTLPLVELERPAHIVSWLSSEIEKDNKGKEQSHYQTLGRVVGALSLNMSTNTGVHGSYIYCTYLDER